MRECKECLIPVSAPDVSLDDFGVCNFCVSQRTVARHDEEVLRKQRAANLESTLRRARGSKAPYDALVCLSGGKDSIYLLYKLKVEYGLKMLAFTTDMNIPPIAWESIRKTVAKLDVELLTFRPPSDFYRKFYRYLLTNQEKRGAVRTVCYVCAPLFEGFALRAATEKGIPLVFAGYSPGQPDPKRMVYEFSKGHIRYTDWTPAALKDSGLFSQQELSLFWNPFNYPENTKFPRYLAPFHAWDYNQEANMKAVVDLGLVKNHKAASPVESNCPLNWLLMYSDLKNLGYNPYAPEFSALIREGKANKLYWQVTMPIINGMIKYQIGLGANVRRSMKWLGLEGKDLIINRPEQEDWISSPPISMEGQADKPRVLS